MRTAAWLVFHAVSEWTFCTPYLARFVIQFSSMYHTILLLFESRTPADQQPQVYRPGSREFYLTSGPCTAS
jgi:hypothetical protein